jgi:hypothetical protein
VTRRTLSIIAAAACLMGAIWCYFNFERVTERDYVGFSGEAARNPLLAFQRLVERMGLKTALTTRPADLESAEAGATLILARNRQGMAALRAERIQQWVAGGGHLIVEAEPPDDPDPLLDVLGVARGEPSSREAAKPLDIRLPGAPAALRVVMPVMDLTNSVGSGAYSARGDGGAAVLDFAYGSGRVTVLASFAFMRNEHIGEHDHAAFAWELVQLAPRTSAVLIATRFERPSLTEWLAREARWPLFAACALLVLWLWRISRRFGPVQPPAEPQRRRLLDHLRASGRFLWATHSAPRLLAAAREACLAKIARTRPGLAELPAAERSARLAQLTEIPREDIELAFDGAAYTPRAFTAAVSTLQQIEEKLTRSVSV